MLAASNELGRAFDGLTWADWVLAAAIVVGSFALGSVVRRITARLVQGEDGQGSVAAAFVGRVVGFLVVVAGLVYGLSVLHVRLAPLLGALFLANQVREYRDLGFGIGRNAYASLFYLITGLHGLHVLVGLLVNLVVQAKLWSGRLSAERHRILLASNLYGHFVDAVWIFVFSSLYLSVRLR